MVIVAQHTLLAIYTVHPSFHSLFHLALEQNIRRSIQRDPQVFDILLYYSQLCNITWLSLHNTLRRQPTRPRLLLTLLTLSLRHPNMMLLSILRARRPVRRLRSTAPLLLLSLLLLLDLGSRTSQRTFLVILAAI